MIVLSDEIEEVLSQGSGQDTDDEYPSDFEEYDSGDVSDDVKHPSLEVTAILKN